jgi:hypothetical protein
MLSCKVPVKPDAEQHNADAEERRTQGRAHLSKPAVGIAPSRVLGCDIKAEAINMSAGDRMHRQDIQLSDGDANGGESKGGSEPCEKGTFWMMYQHIKKPLNFLYVSHTKRQVISSHASLVLELYRPIL